MRRNLGIMEMFDAYDVANKAWIDNGTMRTESMWLQTIGNDYLWYAFCFSVRFRQVS